MGFFLAFFYFIWLLYLCIKAVDFNTYCSVDSSIGISMYKHFIYIYTRLVKTYYVQKTKSQGTTIFGTAHRVVILNNKKNWGRGGFLLICVCDMFLTKNNFLKKLNTVHNELENTEGKKTLTVIWWDNGQNQQFFLPCPSKNYSSFFFFSVLAHSVIVCGRQFSMYTVLTRNDRFSLKNSLLVE